MSSDKILIEIRMVDKIIKGLISVNIFDVHADLLCIMSTKFMVACMYGLVHTLYVIFYGKLYGKYLIWTGISLLLLLEYISGVVFVSLSKT